MLKCRSTFPRFPLALSPLRAPNLRNSRRRKSSPLPALMGLILGVAALAWAYNAFFGFNRHLRAAVDAARGGRTEEATRLLDALEEKKPGDSRIRDIRGLLAARLGKLDEAARDYKATEASLKESAAEVHEIEGEFHLKNGDYKGAELEYAHALGLDKG